MTRAGLLASALLFAAASADAAAVVRAPVRTGTTVNPVNVGVYGALSAVSRQTGLPLTNSSAGGFGFASSLAPTLGQAYARAEAFKAYALANIAVTITRQVNLFEYNPYNDAEVMRAVAALPMPEIKRKEIESMTGPGDRYRKMEGRPAGATDGGDASVLIAEADPEEIWRARSAERMAADRAREQLEHVNGTLKDLEVESDARSLAELRRAGISFDGGGEQTRPAAPQDN